MNPLDVVLVSGGISITLSLLTWVLARRDKRDNDRRPGAPTVQEIWVRQDKQERALDASLVLVGQLVKQHDNPDRLILSKTAIKTLRETGFMPPELEDVLSKNELR